MCTWSNILVGCDDVPDSQVVIGFGGALPKLPMGGKDVLGIAPFDSDPIGDISNQSVVTMELSNLGS